MDDYINVYRLNMNDEWMNGAYDDDGNAVVCDLCGEKMKWNPKRNFWYCASCGQEMDRMTYLNYIGAEPPGSECMTNCGENYPFCKKYCERYKIDPNDPMLT